MSQNALAMPLVGVYSGTTAAGYINNALDTLATKQSGASAPTGPALGWDWLDTSVANQATWKVYDGTSFVSVGTIDTSNHRWVPVVGGGTATVPSATTTDLWDATNNKNHSANVIISGTTTITGLGSTVAVGALVLITFSGVLTFTHDGTNLVLPTGASITTAAGDTCIALCKASGQYRIFGYQKADGSPLLTSGTIGGSFAFTGIITPSALAAQADDYNPTGNATSTIWELSTTASANRVITGISGGTNGRFLIVQNVNATGAGNITIAAQSTSSSAANRLAAPSDIVIRPGEGRTLLYVAGSTNRWTLTSQIGAAGAWGSMKNLSIANNSGTPNSILDAAADELILEDADGNTLRLRTIAQSPNMGASGAGGLDTGTEANSTWYSIWIIYNPATGTVSSLLSLSTTAPTMPSGYTFKMRVGWIYNDASSNFLRILQKGRRAQYVVTAATNTAALPVLISGVSGNVATPTWTAAAVATFVPPTASKIAVVLTVSHGAAAAAMAAPNNAYGPIFATTNPPPLAMGQSVGSGGTTQSSLWADFVLESANVYYASSNANAFLQCQGWEDNI